MCERRFLHSKEDTNNEDILNEPKGCVGMVQAERKASAKALILETVFLMGHPKEGQQDSGFVSERHIKEISVCFAFLG